MNDDDSVVLLPLPLDDDSDDCSSSSISVAYITFIRSQSLSKREYVIFFGVGVLFTVYAADDLLLLPSLPLILAYCFAFSLKRDKDSIVRYRRGMFGVPPSPSHVVDGVDNGGIDDDAAMALADITTRAAQHADGFPAPDCMKRCMID